MFRRSLLLALVTVSSLSAPALLAPAEASTPAPSKPAGLHFMQSGDSYLMVGAHRAAHATGYRLYASTTRQNLYVANLGKAHRSRVWKTPTTTIYGLPRTSKPYYYRVEAVNSRRRAFSTAIGSAGLRPPAPTSAQVASGSAGTNLTWNNSWGTRIVVARATNKAMTTGRYDYWVAGGTHRFTPYGLTKGKRYYYQIQARSYGAKSHWSRQTSAVAAMSEQTVRVVNYNLLKSTSDGTRADGASSTIAPWSQRRLKAAALVKAAHPDVMGVEEGGYYVGSPSRGVRQVDDVTSLLPGYAVAHTETPNPPYYGQIFQDYVVYNTATVNRVAGGTNNCSCGVWELGHQHRAAYAILQMKAGGRFLFVAPHLANPTFSDAYRRSEAQTLLAKVASFNSQHLPVIYGGDFNSDMRKNHVDVPGNVMKATLNETSALAQTKYNASYDSYNQYRRTPPRYSLYLDRIFVSAGVGVKSWGIVLQLTHGSFSGAIPSDHNPVYAAVTIPYRR